MKKSIVAAVIAFGMTIPAQAQDLGSREVIVTAQRIEQDDYSDHMPAVGLRRTADFLIQQVIVSGDTRNAEERKREIYEMTAGALRLAEKNGVELSFGDFIVQPLTLENYTDLTLEPDRRRPDSEFVTFLIKTPLAAGQSASQAQQRIERFIESVPEIGRAQMDKNGEITFSVVAPDSYRGQIADRIAEDARQLAAKLGDTYGVEIEGLNMPVDWSRSGPSEVFLFIPYRLVIVPRP